ncbi:ATP-dependent DNA helicase [Nocardioides sp.]|uniref:ATP-dependent helicase n=1 Tax=Nocardioides sp. TaxID=35761 RepID=UPI002ED09B94
MTTYRLVRDQRPAAGSATRPALDADQQAVVDHSGGPLLVLAGPGTGKTTTLVEAIARRIEDGADPSSVLALTFSRKAAEQLRDRVTARLGRTTGAALCQTFHSFAYGLIRAYSPTGLYDAPLRLLSAPEADVVLRELLTDSPESVRWPESLQRALGTHGFVREVQAVLSRAREKQLDGAQLRALGEQHGLPEFVAAGLFLDQYLTVLDNLGATDYADLIRRAVIEATAHRDELRRRYRHVYVDEYQDTDPGQVALLQELAGDGGDLVVVGDPHQSIYGFRGAEVRGIQEFPSAFPTVAGERAPVVVLRHTRRFGPRLAVAASRVSARIGTTGFDAATAAAFAHPVAEDGAYGEGRVEVRTFDTDRAEAEHLADLLRRAHLEDGIDWSDMAVLVRSGQNHIPPLRRALAAAGVPVEVASDDLPLTRDPAVLPLLEALRAVLHLDEPDTGSVDHVDAARAEGLLLSPLGGLDAGDVRVLLRLLRQREKLRAAEEDRPPAPSRDLLRRAVVERGFLDGVDGSEAAAARALSDLLRRGSDRLAEGAPAEEVLWDLWSGTSWPQRLRRSVGLGGAAARRAHRDLDSLCALFETAARAEERTDHLGVREFLDSLLAQQIPADTLAERGVRGSAVRLLTAHRSKGLEWQLVVVAHVQQESWPDLRRRSTLLRSDRIDSHRGRGELVEPVTPRELLKEERRLFYVACTRARRRLVVTAVASSDDEGEQPSRFLDELEVAPLHVDGRPARPLSLAGLVAELRRTVADPDSPEPLRAAAARRLARLAREAVGERSLVPQADPASWWGTRAPSRADRPVRDPDLPVPVSASLLAEVATCPTHWFLQAEAGGVEVAHQSANLGQIVHALAQRVAAGDLPADLDTLMTEVDAVWDRLSFRTPWSKKREHERLRAALARFLAWHAANPRTLVGLEEQFSAEIQLDSGQRVRLSGYADRLEVDVEGNLVVVDLKTARTAPSGPAVAGDRQLGLYQYAVTEGAFVETTGTTRTGGAELVQLGLTDGGDSAKVQAQDVQHDGDPRREALRVEMERAAAYLRTESFPAVAGPHCRECAFVSLCPVKGAGSVTVL